MKKVLIVGAGFGGLKAAKTLGNKKEVQVTVIDRRNYHLFQPLLYQVATAGLTPAEIAVPIRGELSDYQNINVIMDNVTSVKADENKIFTTNGSYTYDYLILACGAKHSYFGNNDWETFAPGLKTIEQATEIRHRILKAFELAEIEKDIEKQRALLTFVIVGGGPTGVEMAGAIAELSRYTLEKDFRHIDPSRTRVILIEAGNRILSSFDEDLSKKATRQLENIGVQVWTSTRVTEVNADAAKFGEESIRTKTVIWAAGVMPSSLGKSLNVDLDRIGRVIVKEDLSIPTYPNIFVVGDQSHFSFNGITLPGLAPVAIQQGAQAAKNILLDIRKRPRQKFRYSDKGQMATIGRSSAVLDFHGIKLSGTLAWLSWLVVHIYYLIGFQNKIFVILRWAKAWVSFNKGSRLIIDREWRFTNSGDKTSSVD